MCAAYDSPGFRPADGGMPQVFGNGRDGTMTAPGSDGATYQEEASAAAVELGAPVISSPHASSQVAADMPTTTVTAADTAVPGQVPNLEPFTGVPNTWRETFPGPGSPSDHVSTPRHPNSAGLPR